MDAFKKPSAQNADSVADTRHSIAVINAISLIALISLLAVVLIYLVRCVVTLLMTKIIRELSLGAVSVRDAALRSAGVSQTISD